MVLAPLPSQGRGWGEVHHHHQWSKYTGAQAASTASAWSERTSAAGLGLWGRYLIAKNTIIGACAAMRSCQRWAAVPSSACRATPTSAIWPMTMASAPNDMAIGKNALGLARVGFTLVMMAPSLVCDGPRTGRTAMLQLGSKHSPTRLWTQLRMCCMPGTQVP